MTAYVTVDVKLAWPQPDQDGKVMNVVRHARLRCPIGGLVDWAPLRHSDDEEISSILVEVTAPDANAIADAYETGQHDLRERILKMTIDEFYDWIRTP